MVAAACAATPDGTIVVDGLKTDGIEPMIKAARVRADVLGQVSKAHGKAAWFRAGDAFADWASPGPSRMHDGFVTAPGVFSADGVDPASAALAAALPAKPGRTVADLGAGLGLSFGADPDARPTSRCCIWSRPITPRLPARASMWTDRAGVVPLGRCDRVDARPKSWIRWS